MKAEPNFEYLVIVEHWGAIHWGSSVTSTEFVETIKDWAVIANVEMVQAFCETLKNSSTKYMYILFNETRKQHQVLLDTKSWGDEG